METNDVSSFFYYMWNKWSKEECQVVFKSLGWEHFWDKWVAACDAKGGALGASEIFFANIDNSSRILLIKRACLLYDGGCERTHKTIKDLSIGDFFKLKDNGKVYVRDMYDRSTKRYTYYDYDDVSNWHSAKGNRMVITDFEF